MKWIVAVLSVVCIAEAYFVYTAKKERDFFYETLMSTTSGNVNSGYYLAKIHLRLAEDIHSNPVEAQKIADAILCDKGAFPENYLNSRTLSQEINKKLKDLKVEITTYCKSKSL